MAPASRRSSGFALLLNARIAVKYIMFRADRFWIMTLRLKRRITLVLPKVGLFNTSVFRNAAYGLTIRGIKGPEAIRRIDKVLDFVGLSHKKVQNARTVSSGEAQRLGIARALVIEPEILFLDEPTASVDQKNTGIIEGINPYNEARWKGDCYNDHA